MIEKTFERQSNNLEMEERGKNEFEKYEEEVAQEVKKVQKKIEAEKRGREYIDYDEYPLEKLKEEVVNISKEALGNSDIGEIGITTPPTHIEADFALGFFDLAKKLKQKPNEIAKKVAEKINEGESDLIEGAAVQGAFVNIETKKEDLYQETLKKIIELDEKYGESDINAGKVAVIDYSAPNIAKPIGVGHLRSTIIGQVLSNIYHETGYSVVKDNHLGDWGTQFGKLIYAFREWGNEAKIKEDPIEELKNLYVQFTHYAKEHPEANDKAREIFARLEKNDPELVGLWKRFRDLSLEDFEEVYKQLGVEFDTNVGESYFTRQADQMVDECVKKGYCRKDEGSEAVVVDEMGKLPSFLLRKQDGSTLYLSRDMAALKFRMDNFNPDSILYVVGNEQDLNFQQLFELSRRAGYLPEDVEAKHIGFGMVLQEGKKMSTRKGTVVKLEDLISQSIAKSKEILQQKNSDLDEKELNKIAEIVGIGAIIYNDLRQSRTKNISFDWNRMLDLEGGSAVYLQYTCVRINSILNKLNEVFGETDLQVLDEGEISFENKSEFDLAKKLMQFPEVIVQAQKTDSPHHICSYLEELALQFNSFYNAVSIIKTENKELRDSRTALVKSVALVIKKGLSLLNIKVPEKM